MAMIQMPQKAISFFKDNLDDIFESGALAEGNWNKKVANLVCNKTNASNATVTSSNGAGMVALLQVYNRYYNKNKVLLQSNTMYGVKTMVKSGNCDLAGFIDCSNKTLMPTFQDVKNAVDNINDIEQLIILLTHIGGLINPEIEEIADYCKSKDIILLEDCAHSYGATHNGRHSGTFGNAGVYSFYSTKAIFAGEGGVVITNDNAIAEYIDRFVIYDRFEQKMDIGINVRQSEIQALLLYSVLLESDEITANKKIIADKYALVCQEKGIEYLAQNTELSIGNHYKFILLDGKCNINKTFKDILTKTSPVYDYALGNSEDIPNNHICLPVWYNQSDEVTEKVISELLSL
jgi:perosamine synthetase